MAVFLYACNPFGRTDVLFELEKISDRTDERGKRLVIEMLPHLNKITKMLLSYIEQALR